LELCGFKEKISVRTMRIGVYIEPWISQRAGISVFTEHLTRSTENSPNTYITIGSKQMDVPNEHILIPKWKASQLNLLRYLGLAKIDLTDHRLDYIIDPGHFACLDLFKGPSRVVIVHDLTPLLFPKYHKIKSVIAHRLLMNRSLKMCEKIITVSENTKEDVIKHYGHSSKLSRIYPGVRDLSQVEEDAFEEKSDAPFILSVGTIEPRKNHKKLIEAFEAFCIHNHTDFLYIVGDEGWKVSINELIASSSNGARIKYLGYVSKPRLKQLYSRALFSIYISLYEGFGFPLLESMKMGCPVISSNVGSMKEISDEAAILVNPNAKDEIAQSMLRLSSDEDLRRTLIVAGIEQGRKFQWTNYIKELDAILVE